MTANNPQCYSLRLPIAASWEAKLTSAQTTHLRTAAATGGLSSYNQ